MDNVDEVSGGIFIGHCGHAQDTPQLDVLGITHVLSVESFTPLVNKKFQHKFVELDDDEEVDLLGHVEECLKFIGDGLKEGGKVLVHCAAGVSRSTSVTVAFLMHRDKITRDEALSLIKETRSFASPNPGFMEQLALFEAMGYQIDPNNEQYKKHKLISKKSGSSDLDCCV